MVSVKVFLFKIDIYVWFVYFGTRLYSQETSMSGFGQMSEERFNALGAAILMFFLTEPSPAITDHQVDAQFTKLCPLLVGLSQRFQALMSEHGLVIANTICVTPAELQHFSDELHRRLGEDRRMYQSKPVIHPARPLV